MNNIQVHQPFSPQKVNVLELASLKEIALNNRLSEAKLFNFHFV